jgi:hypothetical protein
VPALFKLLAFTIPIQLSLHFDFWDSTVYGFKIDYLISTFYLSDILASLVILFGIKNIKLSIKHYVLSIMYLAFALYNIHNSLFIIPAVYRWFKITEMLLLGLVIINYKKYKIFEYFVKPLSYSIMMACILGILQFINNGSIGGLFYLLGERSFSFIEPGIAPYPYSFFPHPNAFAGFLLVFGIFVLQYRKKFNKKYFWLLAILVGINLILTNSLNVYITAALLLVISQKFLVFSFVSLDFLPRFVSHRIELINSSIQMIKDNFWFGVGLNNFIPNLVKYSKNFLYSWELQPVHNIFLLVFSELGVVGFIAFCFLVFSSLSAIRYSLFAVIVTGLSDHYWLTLQQNMLLFTFVVALSKIKK